MILAISDLFVFYKQPVQVFLFLSKVTECWKYNYLDCVFWLTSISCFYPYHDDIDRKKKWNVFIVVVTRIITLSNEESRTQLLGRVMSDKHRNESWIFDLL